MLSCSILRSLRWLNKSIGVEAIYMNDPEWDVIPVTVTDEEIRVKDAPVRGIPSHPRRHLVLRRRRFSVTAVPSIPGAW